MIKLDVAVNLARHWNTMKVKHKIFDICIKFQI